MDLRAALIGCGNLGRVHAEAVRQIGGGLRFVAFCDVQKQRADDFCRQYGGDYATDDAERVFRDPKIDAVYICTLHDTHAPFCIRAAQAGKHALVEKPLALTVPDCQRVGGAVEKSGIKLFTAFKMRYYDMILKAKELIPQPLMVTMQMMDNTWGVTHWANDPVKGGGNVLSQGCHAVDVLYFVIGREPVRVFAEGANFYQPSGVIDNLTATFRFEGDAIGSWVQGDAHGTPHVSKFFMQTFAKGRSCTLTDRFTTLVYSEAGRKQTQTFKGAETGFVEENRAFIECLRKNTRPTIDHRDGLRATLMVLKAFESLRTGRPQSIW